MDYGNRNYNAAGSFSFPVLKPSELLRCMGDLGMPFTEDDMNKPTTPRILAVYEHFTHIFMGVTREQYSQPSFNTVQILEYPELHQDSISLMAYYRQLRKLMVEVGVADFNMRDILRPEPPRVRRCLSAVINFAKFREERLGVYETCTAKGEETVARRQVLDVENRDLSEKVNSLRLKRAEQEPEIQALRNTNSALTADLRELQKQQAALTSGVDSLKREKNDLSESLSKTQMTILDLKQNCVRLKSRIVQSPEKLKASISDMNSNLQSDKATVASTEKRARELQVKIDMMSAVEQDITSCLKLMEECDAESKKAEVALRKVATDKENIDKRRSDMRELDFREEQLKRQLNGANDKLARLENHQSVKTGAINTKIEKLKEAFQLANIERTQNQRKTDENAQKALNLEAKTMELRRQEAVDAAGLDKMVAKLASEVSKYQLTLEKAMMVSS
ncbi:kinetochore-associated Ndc80 complex subunit nuf2 [Thoreauomyces humboldtii]|nr:kinetochore-associated Ndc80 complex subunit nuf2 [Thoreauomyces humboldtii]